MIGLIQRVIRAHVEVEGETVGAIDAGLLALVAVQPGDGEAQAQRLLERMLGYRIFADAEGRMNRSLAESGGGLLLVSQFTLAADTKKGMRPGFSTAAAPAEAEPLVQPAGRTGAHGPSAGGNRPLRCPYGSASGQRRAGHVLARSALNRRRRAAGNGLEDIAPDLRSMEGPANARTPKAPP